MSYQLFVRILAQLSQKNQAKIDIEDQELIISKSASGWEISTPILPLEALPLELQSLSFLRWQSLGEAYLSIHRDSHFVYLAQEIKIFDYIAFKALSIDFLNQATEWQYLLDEMAEKECVC